VKHPHPWSLRPENEAFDDMGAILDADGVEICDFGRCAPYDSISGDPPTEPYATQMVLAPEMEDVIRSIVGKQCWPGECIECGADLQRGETHGVDCKLNNILVKIDTARKRLDTSERIADRQRAQLKALEGLPSYHQILEKLCTEFGVPGAPNLGEVVVNVKKRLGRK